MGSYLIEHFVSFKQIVGGAQMWTCSQPKFFGVAPGMSVTVKHAQRMMRYIPFNSYFLWCRACECNRYSIMLPTRHFHLESFIHPILVLMLNGTQVIIFSYMQLYDLAICRWSVYPRHFLYFRSHQARGTQEKHSLWSFLSPQKRNIRIYVKDKLPSASDT